MLAQFNTPISYRAIIAAAPKTSRRINPLSFGRNYGVDINPLFAKPEGQGAVWMALFGLLNKMGE